MAPEGLTDTGMKSGRKSTRKLFNANDAESAEALNEAAGSTIAVCVVCVSACAYLCSTVSVYVRMRAQSRECGGTS